MMKSVIKRVIGSVVGERNLKKITRKLKGRKYGFSESDLIYNWFHQRQKNGIMFDVGSHYGESLSPYLKMGWEVYAFEPDPRNVKIISQKLDPAKIHFYKCALSNIPKKEVDFYASTESDGISSLSPFRKSHEFIKSVEVKTLKEIVEENKLTTIDYLKIDTEGHDLFVLQGLNWSIIHPKVILCEFEDSKTKPLGYGFRDLGNFLIGKEYYVFLSEWEPIKRYGGRHAWEKWSEFPAELRNEKAWGNYIAFHKSLNRQEINIFVKSYFDTF